MKQRVKELGGSAYLLRMLDGLAEIKVHEPDLLMRIWQKYD
jgi:hypothetical protein